MRTYEDWRGMTAYDSEGQKVGTIDEIYADPSTGQPEWIGVTTGLFGTKHSMVPIAGTTEFDGGMKLAYTKEVIKDAPNVDATGGLTLSDEQELFGHYDFDYAQPNYGSRSRLDKGYARPEGEAVGEATAVSQDANITENREQVRLRKYRWTEQVPVQKEEVRVEKG